MTPDYRPLTTDEIIEYARRHRGDDPFRLLLKGGLPDALDPQRVADQLEGLALASTKWPWLAANDNIAYPCRLSREQSSSQAAAHYKAELIASVRNAAHAQQPLLADLTGGMGVDSLVFASVAEHVDYIERDNILCNLMSHNANALSLNNITVHNTDCVEWLETNNRHYDWFYIDPARRGKHGQKLASLTDCQPDVVCLLPMIKPWCDKLLIKTSPMIDITQASKQLNNVVAVHIVAVNHECKEVLFVLQCSQAPSISPLAVTCVDLWHNGRWENSFSADDAATPVFASSLCRYLYEPNASLMKGAHWGGICQWYNVSMLDPCTHLYTSDNFVADFPGRIFEVLKQVKLNRKAVTAELKHANVIARNYPATADTLRRQLGLADGGDDFIVATTIRGKKTGILARRLSTTIN